MKKITVKENEEFRVKVITEFNENEFFYDAFVKAKNETECIVNDTISYHQTKNDTMLDFSNNIIAFSGDRGQGKSSALLSFSNLLNNCNKNPYSDFLGALLKENNYIVLDRIDPTKFEDKDNILLIILGKIFNKFCAIWNVSDKKNMVKYSNLLEQFQICYDEIMTIKNTKDPDCTLVNALENLGRIGDSGNLKKNLWKLLELFFEFENVCTNIPVAKEKNYLVIQLDDTDLNIENAYKIVEDIRKYFMIPNVIVLMAIDINQLTKSIEQYFINKYYAYNEYYDNRHLIEHRKVAVKYIDKLIPGDRKIYLPKLTLITGENAEKVKLEYIDCNKNNILSFRDTEKEVINDFQELIIRLIYEKTGIVFVKPQTYVHNIIPNTMRELVNFLSVLNKMPNIKNSYTEIEDLNLRMENLKNFETYFIEVWIPNYVHYRYQENIMNFIAASITTKNKQFVKDLKANVHTSLIGNYRKQSIHALNSDARITDLIMSIEKRGIYSLADIRSVLNAFEDEFPQEDTYKFIFSIKTLYTIYINKIICSQLIHEKNDEPVDNDLLLNFLGDEIFSIDEINNFIRKEKGLINRGAFEIVARYSIEAQSSMERMINTNPFLIPFFLNFSFHSSQGKLPEYKIPYKAANGVVSKHFKYGAFSPIVKFLEPKTSLRRLDVFFEPDSIEYIRFDTIRYQCMKIVSNMDLINYISEELQDYSLMRSEKWDYSNYLINLYDRLESCIDKLHYYDLGIDFESLRVAIAENAFDINDLYAIYKEVDAELDVKTIENRENLSEYLAKLNTLRNTRTFENLKRKISDLSKKLLSFNKWLKDSDLDLYIFRLDALKENLYSLYGNLDSESRGEYQGEYNRIVKELKIKFDDNPDD